MRLTLNSAVRLGLLTACAMGALVTNSAQAQTTLRWKFQKGETLSYTMVQKTTNKINAGNQNVEYSFSQTIDNTWVVKDVTADGQAEVAQTFDRIQTTMDLPNMKIEYDSKDGKLPE